MQTLSHSLRTLACGALWKQNQDRRTRNAALAGYGRSMRAIENVLGISESSASEELLLSVKVLELFEVRLITYLISLCDRLTSLLYSVSCFGGSKQQWMGTTRCWRRESCPVARAKKF